MVLNTSHSQHKFCVRIEDTETKKVYKIYIKIDVAITNRGVKLKVF